MPDTAVEVESAEEILTTTRSARCRRWTCRWLAIRCPWRCMSVLLSERCSAPRALQVQAFAMIASWALFVTSNLPTQAGQAARLWPCRLPYAVSLVRRPAADGRHAVVDMLARITCGWVVYCSWATATFMGARTSETMEWKGEESEVDRDVIYACLVNAR